MKYTLTIDNWRPASLNTLANVHWAVRRRRKQVEYDTVSLRAYECGVPKAKAQRSVSLHITLPKGARRYDDDNCWKSLLDALVKCGLLVNDSPRWCHTGTITYLRGERLSTTIVLEEEDEPGEGPGPVPALVEGRRAEAQGPGEELGVAGGRLRRSGRKPKPADAQVPRKRAQPQDGPARRRRPED